MTILLTMLASALVSSPPSNQAVVVRPVADMFARATEDSSVVSQAIYATTVDILEQEQGWVRARTPDHYTGWMPLQALRLLQLGEAPYGTRGPVAWVAALYAHIYREADVTRRRPLLTVPFETRLEIAGEPADKESRWLEVRLVDGRAGWIQRGDVSFESRPLSIPEVIELSRRFLGLPYTWGGTSSFGFDCSGFTQMLCRRRGITIPRDASPQADWGGMTPVNRADLQPGDLVYFGESSSQISHTGMYIGEGRFIHASTHGRPVVQIGELADEHWSRLFQRARRLKGPAIDQPAVSGEAR